MAPPPPASSSTGSKPAFSQANSSLPLGLYLSQKVLLLTQDGRVLLGVLQGFDAVGSVILSSTIERIFSAGGDSSEDDAAADDEGQGGTQPGGVEEVELGLYVLRGDAIALIGDVDQERDSRIPWSDLAVDGIPEVRFA